MAYLLHSLDCRYCSDRLAHESALLDTEPAEAEESLLRELATSSETGRLELAEVMHRIASSGDGRTEAQNVAQNLGQSGGRGLPRPFLSTSVRTQVQSVAAARTPFGRPRFFWPAVSFSALAAALAAFVVLPLVRPAPDRKLLAVAYDKDRLSELRVPGEDAGALASPTRGVDHDAASSELLKVRLRAQQQFERDPNDARLRQRLAEIAIVEHDGEAARRSLEMAEALDPKLAGLDFDLGSAYFEIAETSGDPLNYGRATDFFSRHLDAVHGKDAVALFDRGLCWERQAIFAEARKDFAAALALEPDAGWRREIEQHLGQVQQKDHPAGGGSGAPDVTPGGFLKAAEVNPQRASEQYELYLDAAMKGWIGQRGSSAEADQALERLAAIGVEHKDAWLHDWLEGGAAGKKEQEREADQQLSLAVAANGRGEATAALPAARLAADLYFKAGNKAGHLRAEAETVYTLNRTLQAKECLDRAVSLRGEPALGRYAWMRGYVLLEAGACEGNLGNLAGDLEDSGKALAVAVEARLPVEELRSRFFLAETYGIEGKTGLAWKMATEGLAASALQGNPARSYAFLAGLGDISGDLRLYWAARGIAEAAVDAGSRTGNARDYGYSLDLLGRTQSKIGDFAGADRSFDAADKVLTQAGTKGLRMLLQPEIGVNRAASLAQRGQLPAATNQMERVEQEAAASAGAGTVDLALRRETEAADLSVRAGHTQDALHHALLAVAVAEETLAPLHTELQRRSWETRTSAAYELAVQCLLNQGNAEEALRLWEWHQAAGFRAADAALVSQPNPALPVTPGLPVVPAGEVTLVFAKIQDHYVAWVVSGNGNSRVRAVTLTAIPERIALLASSFSRLCADRNSSLVDLGVLGKNLYRELLSPFESELGTASVVRLETGDSVLRAIPFAALPVPDGRYLVERQSILLLPTWWSLHEALNEHIDRQMHLVVVNGTELPAAYDETSAITSRFPNSYVLPQAEVNTRQILSLLPRADIFHYNGHGSTDSERSGLILSRSHQLFTADVLAGVQLKRCRLAVLAACETDVAVSNSMEDSGSLPHALLNAGVPAVVATEWAIDSESSDRLMVEFYNDLAKGRPIAEALQTAQVSLLKTSERHPYFWSAFRLFEN